MLKSSALAADICIGSAGGNRSEEAGPASIVICENAVMVRAEGQRGAVGPRLGVPSQYHFAATELNHPGPAYPRPSPEARLRELWSLLSRSVIWAGASTLRKGVPRCFPAGSGPSAGDDHCVFLVMTGRESWAAASLMVWAFSFHFFTCVLPPLSSCFQPFLPPHSFCLPISLKSCPPLYSPSVLQPLCGAEHLTGPRWRFSVWRSQISHKPDKIPSTFKSEICV